MRALSASLCWCSPGCRLCCPCPWGILNLHGEKWTFREERWCKSSLSDLGYLGGTGQGMLGCHGLGIQL